MAASLTTQAEALLDQAGLSPTETPAKYSRLSPDDVGEMLRLKRLNPDVTHDQISAVLGCSRQAVTYWLGRLADSVDDAAIVLKADALDAALTLGDLMRRSRHDKVKLDAAKANLTANKLLGNEDKQVMVGVQVVIGMPGSPAGPDPVIEQ